MTLSEELLLLAPAASDEPGANFALNTGLIGALLLDLAAEGLVVAKGKAVVGVAGTASHPLLGAALAELLASDEPRAAQHWLVQLPSALAPLPARVSAALGERGVLDESRGTELGLEAAPAGREVDPAPEHELRSRLRRVLVFSGESDVHTALLISLLRSLGIVRTVVDKQHRKQADALAKAIALATADAAVTPASVSREVHAAQAAVLAALAAVLATT